jgi:hypothetical protein
MAATRRETVRLLCKSIVTRLENQHAIAFPPRLRQIVAEDVSNLVGPYIMTDEDIRSRALDKMGGSREVLSDTTSTESDQFKAAKAVVRATFGDDELNGLYFQKPLKNVAEMIAQYFMRSSNIDEVYESDAEIEKKIVEMVQRFKESDLH